MRVFQPLALAGEPVPGRHHDFERGLPFAYEFRWAEALAHFTRIEDDEPSRRYAERCRELVTGERDAWDGTWNLTEK